MKIKVLLLLLAAGGCLNHASAKVGMPHCFSDNMVLQADTVAQLWGRATPGAQVCVNCSWGEEAASTADASGKWRVGVSTPAPSYEAYTVTVTDGADNDAATFSNVLAGEVWLASGQSNMDMPLRGYWHQPIEGAGDEITFSTKLGRGIRFLNVPRKASDTPQEDIDAVWQVSCPANTAEFSALAWFFARYLKDIIDCPVGIINSAYGGSKVEEWRDGCGLYNAMICPLVGYTARGIIWNQGESNVGAHTSYPDLQKDMLMHWREMWHGPEMQFYYVELPGWDYGDAEGTNAA
ncbi:MAG: sialate O-acetylesterase, partial [Muribaculaceae bacterium]|nr:sialate O-acetylesterase [Muribaculaceae bacterium]